MRDVYPKPSKEFELNSNQLLKLMRPLYGLSYSGDNWNVTFAKHIKEDLGMSATAGDMSLFFRNQLSGLLGTYVDDSLLASDADFLKLSDKFLESFESKEREMDNTRFAGVYIETVDNGFRLHQKGYIERLSTLPPDCDFARFRSARTQLTWMGHTRPDICAAANMMAQVTDKLFDAKHIRLFSKTVRRLKETTDFGLKMQKLDVSSLHLKVFSDSSFANNPDLSSQLGYIVLLCDKYNRCNVLHYSSHKSRRVVRSVLGGEIYAFADAFDYAFTMKHDLDNILDKHIPLQMLTDSKSLFDVITKSSITTERRLMIDIQVAREAYEELLISDVGFVLTNNNPADAFTKIGNCDALARVLSEGNSDFDVKQWVIRKAPISPPTTSR